LQSLLAKLLNYLGDIMLIVHSMRLKNIVHFKDVYVPITQNCGLVVVSGHNKDSRSDNQNNGAGKSLLFSALPNAVYGASPSSTLKNTKKDLLGKGSEIEIRFIDNAKRKIKLVQTASKWSILEDGVDQEVHRLTNQQDKITQLFPLTQDEFYSYAYLSSISGQRIHFQVDRPAERLKFITSVFQLDSYDKLKHYFTQRLSLIKDEQIRFDVLGSKLLNINTQLERLNWSTEHAAKYKEDKLQFEELKKKRSSTNKRVTSLDRAIYVLIDLLKKVEERDSLRESLPNKPLSEIKANLRARLSAISAYEVYLSDVKRYKRNTEKLKEQLDALDLPTQSAKEIDSLLVETSEELLAIRAALAEAKTIERQALSLKAEIDRWIKDLKALGYARPSLVPALDKDDDLSIYETTLKLKQLLDNNEDSICPTCLQAVDIDAIRVNVKKAEKKVKELRAIRKAHTIVEKLLDLDKRYMALGSVDATDDLHSQEKAYVSKEQQLKSDASVLREHSRLLKSVKDIEKPVKPERVPKNLDAGAIEEALNMCATLDRIEEEVSRLTEDHHDIVATSDNLTSLQQEVAAAKAMLEKIDCAFNGIMKRISEFDLKRGEYQLLMTQKLEYETELQSIKPLLDKRDIYKALEKAYGAKGLKVNKANEILSLIENNMNKYSGLVFAEPFSFRVYATDQGVMSEVHRRKTGLATDSRLLSGSESDCFKLLFMLSLLMLVPSTQRTNFVVLDEPDSHMDSVARVLFAEQYIPFLRSVVPHVFLITPKDADVFQEYDQWVVVKENGESILEIK
jgi:hypothetical protein